MYTNIVLIILCLQLQALVRMWRARKAYRERLHFFKDNVSIDCLVDENNYAYMYMYLCLRMYRQFAHLYVNVLSILRDYLMM